MGKALRTAAIANGLSGFGSEYPLYGALEIKSCYQKHMVMGVLFAATVHLMIVGGVAVYRHLMPPDVYIPVVTDLPGPTVVTSPASIQSTITIPGSEILEQLASEIGIPIPVSDDQAPTDVEFITKKGLEVLNSPVSPSDQGSLGGTIAFNDRTADSEYFPPQGAFTPVETYPVRIDQNQLKFPEMAVLTETEGVVWIEALVDREGKVREVRVVKPSGSNVGFEQAALDFSSKHLYKPAIQNGRPVAVRITFRVEFRLGQR